MSDSKEKPQPETNPAEETTAIVTKNQFGVETKRLKDASGRFVKTPKPLPPTIEFTRAERKALLKDTGGGMNEYLKMFMNIVRIAQYDGDDAKEKMAAVQAFKEVRLSALGKPAPSEQEMDKLTTQPVKVIVLPVPSIMNPEVVDGDKKREDKKKPTFIDAVFEEDKEK